MSFKGFFEEDSKLSMTRLMSLISLICGCCLGTYGVYAGKDLMGLAALCGVFITAAFGAKIGQKMMEKSDK